MLEQRHITPQPPPAGEVEPQTDERAEAIDSALRNVCASITVLDDEAYPALHWQERDELIQLLREAVRELRKL